MPTSTLSDSSPAVQALRDSLHPALRRLSVEENDTCVVISGRVGSFYLKQLAQEAIMPVRGSREIVNRVTVALGQ